MGWVDLAAWLITLADAAVRFRDSAFEPVLCAIALVGLAGAVMWLRRRRGWRVTVVVAVGLYAVHYAVRFYVLEVEPLLSIMPMRQAVADAFYVLWSSPMGRLSRGEILDAAAELWRECLMPLVQIGMLAAATRAR